MVDRDIKFPRWEGYKDLEEVKKMIKIGCFDNPMLVLEHDAKMSIEREYFKDMLLYIQYRIQKYLEEGEGLGLGIDSSREIFEGLMIVPAEEVSYPEDNDKDNCEQFIEDMKKAGIECEEYEGRFFYHGPAVRTNENGFPTRQDIIRATKVKVQWDNLGLDFIVYPV